MDILKKIILNKKKEVESIKRSFPISNLEESIYFDRHLLSMKKSIIEKSGLISEFKRKSPSVSDINLNASVKDVAKGYELANSSGIKVGITRGTQGVIRWMDQGASQAILLAEVPNRRFSGDIEVSLKRFVADVTNWRKMLSGEPDPVDLIKMKEELSVHVPEELKQYILPDNTVTEIRYPVNKYPVKIKSVKLDKFPVIEGTLLGIKGQYLLLDEDRVFNVRSHEGYIAKFSHQEIAQQGVLF